MEKIYLSDYGPKVSPAIYGFWRWDDSSAAAENEMEKIINLCLELGINTFDHADKYAGFLGEEIFGKVMEKKSFKREDIVLFTKCGLNVPHPNNPGVRIPHVDTSAAHITRSVENSLRKLQTDYIDIFLLDQLDHLSDLEETVITLERLKHSGKIRNLGVANFSVFKQQLLANHLRIPVVTNHIELNVLQTQAIDNGQLDYIRQKYSRPIASAPLADGRIENGTDAQAVKVRAKLEEIGKKYDSTVESTAVAWLNKLGALPLIGTRNEQRIRNIVNAFNINMDHQDWYDLYYTSIGQ
ncbi:aldo/keto reductase [Flavihumibacter solisilvae]|uniref:Aldo/keto reductase n=1 Tax=Flavihumibacter solisilvae TaxID=1349421 RepID=A0A0C1LB48_9BACT|nr:aldo/keto reductase [Flavihumibacter solisilvae]KIC92753.1 aldo/keto reductase [Flavihumibacter solisilvae]